MSEEKIVLCTPKALLGKKVERDSSREEICNVESEGTVHSATGRKWFKQ